MPQSLTGEGATVMQEPTAGFSASPVQSERSGGGVARTGLIAGIVAVVLTALTAVLTFTLLLEATPFNGPLALIGFLGPPAALVGALCGALGLRSVARTQAIAGLVLSILSIAAWVLILTNAPWPE